MYLGGRFSSGTVRALIRRPYLDHRQPTSIKPRHDHAGGLPERTPRMSSGRPPEAGGFDSRLGQSAASEIRQGVRSLGRPEAGGGILHQLQGIGQGQPRGLSGGAGGGLDGRAGGRGPRAGRFPRGGNDASLFGKPANGLGKRQSPKSHHQLGGVPMLATTKHCHVACQRIDTNDGILVVVERARRPPDGGQLPSTAGGGAKQTGRHGGQVDPIADRLTSRSDPFGRSFAKCLHCPSHAFLPLLVT